MWNTQYRRYMHALVHHLRVTVTYTLIFTLLIPSPQIYAAIELDQAQTGASLDKAQNGVDVVNIAAPSASGLSQNRFKHYSVPKSGVIINNATQNGVSKLGGAMYNNPHFTGTAASKVLFNVTGSSKSDLRGATEMFGQSAAFILANPNGIQINGGEFINIPRSTLTTGTPQFQNGQLSGFDVNQGKVVVEGLGLNASNVDYVDIIARAAEIRAAVWAGKSLDLVLGRNVVDYETNLITVKGDDGSSKPAYALDAAALGAMNAGTIKLISTEKGVGVNSQSSIVAKTDDVILDAQGNITFKDIRANRDSRISTPESITQTNSSYAQRNSQMTAGKDITLNGAHTVGKNELTITSGRHTTVQQADKSTGTAFLESARTTIRAANDIYINDSNALNTNFTLDADGNIKLSNSTIQSGTNALSSKGDTTLQNSVIYSDDTILVESIEGAVSVDRSSIGAKKDVTLKAKDTIQVNSATVVSDDSLHLETTQGNITASASRIQSGKSLDLVTKQGNITSTTSHVESGADLTITATRGQRHQSSTLKSGSNLTLSAQGDIQLDKTTAESNTDLSITSTDGSVQIANTSKVQGQKSVTLNASQSLSVANSTVLSGDTLALDGSSSVNITNSIVASAGDLRVASKGDITSESGSKIESLKSLTVTSLGKLKNLASRLYADGTVRLTADTQIDNTAGFIGSKTDTHITSKGAVSNSGTIQSGGSTTLRAATLTNTGAIISGSNTEVSANVVTNTGASITAVNDLSVTANTIHNQNGGRLASGRDLILHTTGSIHNHDTNQVDANGHRVSGLIAGRNIHVTSQETVDNKKGTFIAGGAVQLTSKQLDNSDTGLIQGLATATDSTITTGTATNVKGRILTLGRLIIRALSWTNTDGAILTANTLDLESKNSQLNNERGLLFALKDMVLRNVTNRYGRIEVGGKLDYQNTNGTIDNQYGRILGFGQNSSLNLATTTFLNANGIVLSNKDVSLSLLGAQVHQLDGQVAAGDTVHVSAYHLDNRATIQAGNHLKVESVYELGNHGQLLSNGTAEIRSANRTITNNGAMGALGHLTLYGHTGFSNTGVISGGDRVDIYTRYWLTNTGRISGKKKLEIGVHGGRLLNLGQIGSASDTVISGYTLTNENGLIFSGGNMELAFGHRVENYNGNILSMGTMSIGRSLSQRNSNIINRWGVIESNSHMTLLTNSLENYRKGGLYWLNRSVDSSHKGKNETILLRYQLPEYSNNADMGFIGSGGDMAINTIQLHNFASVIQSGRHLTANTNLLNNVQWVQNGEYVQHTTHQVTENLGKAEVGKCVGQGTVTGQACRDIWLGSTLYGNQYIGLAPISEWNPYTSFSFQGQTYYIDTNTMNKTIYYPSSNDDWYTFISVVFNGPIYQDNIQTRQVNNSNSYTAEYNRVPSIIKAQGNLAINASSVSNGGNVFNGGWQPQSGTKLGDTSTTTATISNAVQSGALDTLSSIKVPTGSGGLFAKSGNKVSSDLSGTSLSESIKGKLDVTTAQGVTGVVGDGLTNQLKSSVPSLLQFTGVTISKQTQNPNAPKPRYLVETNFEFIDMTKFLGSDYLLSRLGIDLNRISLLGDQLYETRLIRETILRETGRRYLNNGITSDYQQMAALYDAALQAQREQQLKVGYGLTQDQIDDLKQDIIWLVEETIDGQKVLVPKIYLSQNTRAKISGYDKGARLAGTNVLINASGSVTNTGEIEADNAVVVSAGSIANAKVADQGGIIRADRLVSLSAIKDLLVQGGTIQSNDTVALNTRDGDIRVESTVQSDRQIGGIAKIDGKTVIAKSGRNIALTGAQLNATDSAQLEAEGDVAIKGIRTGTEDIVEVGETVKESSNRGIFSLFNPLSSAKTIRKTTVKTVPKYAKTVLNTAKNLIVKAKGDAIIESSEIASGANTWVKTGGSINAVYDEDENNQSRFTYGTGQTILEAGEDINIVGQEVSSQGNLALIAKQDITVSHLDVQEKNNALPFLSTTTRKIGKVTTAGDLLMQAGRDMTVNGGELSSGGDMALSAGNDLTIGTIVDTTSTGPRSAGGNWEQSTTTTTHTGSTVSAGGALSMNAGNEATIVGSDVKAGKNLDITGSNGVNILAATDSTVYKKQDYDLRRTGGFDHRTLKDTGLPVKVEKVAADRYTNKIKTTQTVSTLTAGTGMSINTNKDLNIEGAKLQTGGTAALTAGRNINIVSAQEVDRNEKRNGKNYDLDSHTTNKLATIDADTIQTNASNDTTLVGANLTANKAIDIQAGGNITSKVAYDEKVAQHASSRTSGWLFKTTKNKVKEKIDTTAQGNTIASGGSVNMNAGNTLTKEGGSMTSGTSTTLTAKNDVALTEARETHTDNEKTKTTWGLDLGIVKFDVAKNISEKASNLSKVIKNKVTSGTNTTLTSTNRDVVVQGTDITAGTAASIAAKRDIRVQSAVELEQTTEKTEKERLAGLGFRAGRSSVTAGVEFSGEKHEKHDTQVRQVESSIAAGTNVNMDSGNDTAIVGSQVVANGDIRVKSGNNLNVVSAEDAQTQIEEHTKSSAIAGLTLRNELLEAAHSVGDLQNAYNNSQNAAKEPDVNGKRGVNKAAADANLAFQSGRTMSQLARAGGSIGTMGFTGGVGVDTESRNTQNNQQNTTAKTSVLHSGSGNIDLEAGNDLNVKGSGLIADTGDIKLKAKNTVTIEAAKNTFKNTNQTTSSHTSVSLETLGQNSGQTGGNLGSSEGNGYRNEVQWTNSQVQASNGTLTIESGADTKLKGAVATAKDTKVTTGGTLTVESLQDTVDGNNNSANRSIGAGSTGKLGVNSVGYGETEGSEQKAWVTQQTALTGTNSVDVNAKALTLTGGLIANQKTDGTDGGNLKVKAETITATDIQDYDRSQNREVNTNVNLGTGLNPGDKIAGGTTSVKYKDRGHDKTQTIGGVIGQGSITTGSETSNLKRGLDQAQVMTKDEQLGGTNTNVTIDNQAFKDTGKYIEDTGKAFKDLPENLISSVRNTAVAVTNLATSVVDQSNGNAKGNLIQDYEGKLQNQQIALEMERNEELKKALANQGKDVKGLEQALEDVGSKALESGGNTDTDVKVKIYRGSELSDSEAVANVGGTTQSKRDMKGFHDPKNNTIYINADRHDGTSQDLMGTMANELSHKRDKVKGIAFDTSRQKASNQATNEFRANSQFYAGKTEVNKGEYNAGLASLSNKKLFDKGNRGAGAATKVEPFHFDSTGKFHVEPRYGNFGGGGWTGGTTVVGTPQEKWKEPVDALDEIFKRHDIGYGNNEKKAADENMVRDLKKLDIKRLPSDKQPKNILYAEKYRDFAINYFEKKLKDPKKYE